MKTFLRTKQIAQGPILTEERKPLNFNNHKDRPFDHRNCAEQLTSDCALVCKKAIL